MSVMAEFLIANMKKQPKFALPPADQLEDLRGTRVRVAESSLKEDVITALPAVPVPMAFDQV